MVMEICTDSPVVVTLPLAVLAALVQMRLPVMIPLFWVAAAMADMVVAEAVKVDMPRAVKQAGRRKATAATQVRVAPAVGVAPA